MSLSTKLYHYPILRLVKIEHFLTSKSLLLSPRLRNRHQSAAWDYLKD